MPKRRAKNSSDFHTKLDVIVNGSLVEADEKLDEIVDEILVEAGGKLDDILDDQHNLIELLEKLQKIEDEPEEAQPEPEAPSSSPQVRGFVKIEHYYALHRCSTCHVCPFIARQRKMQ